jgi:hypothetical protein
MSTYIDDKAYIKQLQEANYKLKDEMAEFRVQFDAVRRLIDKATDFLIGYDENGGEITVQKRSEGKWAVCQHGFCLNETGQWEFERLPSNRGDDFLARTRFSFDVAMRLASEKVVSQERIVRKSKMIEEVIIDV